MRLIDDSDLKYLETIFAVSNTPYYLFKKLRNDDTLISFAGMHSSRELIISFQDTLKEGPTDFGLFVYLYIIIAALTLKDDKETEQFFQYVAKLGFKWFRELSEYYFSAYREPVQFIEIKPIQEIKKTTIYSSDASLNNLSISHQPSIETVIT